MCETSIATEPAGAPCTPGRLDQILACKLIKGLVKGKVSGHWIKCRKHSLVDSALLQLLHASIHKEEGGKQNMAALKDECRGPLLYAKVEVQRCRRGEAKAAAGVSLWSLVELARVVVPRIWIREVKYTSTFTAGAEL
ncbi:hypothetical protein Cni_G10847 [Canna indica]|uniref:Uncharacterized protein n=1 Tax=Canna indica TaxID=4628 RepID=A0AAQ3QAN9_9LILI|nr:hypothetical protein Cni_G10847 [Canna indica]